MIRCLLVLAIAFLIPAAPIPAGEPRVASLVPGLDVRRLPVRLTNIDSLNYGPDGRLYAAGYDGRVHALTDSDGDGLEDTVVPFWDQRGDLLTPMGILPVREGVYVAARGKIALLKDTDGDGRADTSETVVSGWVREKHNSDTRNDAAGLAMDRDGHLYFSLGCMSYNKAWLLDADGHSHYDIGSERGTILKVSPDRSRREILATGLRFVVGLEFNRHGDLFATDQEGDTWFPGGNPRDELLHIIPGRHYGFPFRHPQYLPDSVDEPFVVGFSPQHQSSCGFRFNETRTDRGRFGPEFWDGDAIVTGFSRGKLWRVPLAKTRSGYVGRQVQILAFESLPTDVAISPAGDLVVACHSGKPDWGAGPSAEGYLYKVTRDREAPQPVMAWASNPLELKVAFDRPIDPNRLGAAEIAMGEFVREGDDHEWIWPGYAVVKAEKAAPRRPLAVQASRVSADGRTLTLATAPLPWRTGYVIKQDGIAGLRGASAAGSGDRVELFCDIGGVQASWTAKGESQPAWSGWLPHCDTRVVRAMTRGSAEHAELVRQLDRPGRLVMDAMLLLPGRTNSFQFEADGPFKVDCGGVRSVSKEAGGRHCVSLTLRDTDPGVEPAIARPRRQGDPPEFLAAGQSPLRLELDTGSDGTSWALDVSYRADHDPHARPLRLEHLLVPWAPRLLPPPNEATALAVAKAEGDPVRGRELFFGARAGCSTCHKYGGQGGSAGPDLTVSVGRDPEAVLRDIVRPNDAINPDYVSFEVRLGSGEELTGVFQSATDDSVVLVDAQGNLRTLSRREVVSMRSSATSLMPEGLDALGGDDLRDLVAFLCLEQSR